MRHMQICHVERGTRELCLESISFVKFNNHSKDSYTVGMSWEFILEVPVQVATDYFET